MSTSIDDWTLEGIKNPQVLQSYILDKFSESTGGKQVIVDGNNPTSFLIEGFSSLTSKLIQKIDDTVLPAIYPSRAQSITDLYKHLSDYDYLGLFASPASCTIVLIVEQGYLMRNAVEVGTVDGVTVKQVVIPQTTRFKIGNYVFGLYYPIRIRVSSETGMFVVEYDNTVNNPLHILSQNILEHSFYRNEGLNLAYIKIPVYQFDTQTTEEPLVDSTGYRRVIEYTDKFYALKCTADVRDPETDTWSNQELALALSGRTYNPENPTVVFSVDPANKQCIVEIPYVYFTQNLIRGNIRVDIYTTAGYLNYQIPTGTSDTVGIDMFTVPLDTEVRKYTEPFRKMPALAAIPVTTQVVGGTNGYSYTDLRKKVIADAFGDATLQTPADIDAYFSNLGYVTSLFKDGITDRIFNAHATLRDTDDAIIAAGCVDTLITLDTLKSRNSSTIITTGEDVYTILPSTRYKFDSDKGICVPLTDDELNALNGLGATDKVNAFNNATYTLCPFHIQLSLKDRYPTSATFDMTDSAIESRTSVRTRTDVAQHLAINSALLSIVPVDATRDDDMITDKYRITLNIIRSGMNNVEAIISNGESQGIANIRCVVGVKTLDGSYVFADAEYLGRESEIDTYQLLVSATAAFTSTEEGRAVRIKAPFSVNGVDVLLTTEIRVILCVRNTVNGIAETVSGSKYNSTKILDTDFTMAELDDIGSYIALSEHQLVVRFGKMVNEVDQRIALSYSGIQYKKYATTEMATLDYPIYVTDENGVPILSRDNKLQVKYPVGTLKAATIAVTEDKPISYFLRKNLAGCDAIHNNSKVTLPSVNEWVIADGKYSGPDAALLTDLDGTSIPVDGFIVPSFEITAARLTLAGINPIIGTYEVADAKNTGPLSSASDEWYRVFKTTEINASGSTDNVTNIYKISAMDALKFVVNYILTRNGAKSPVHVVDAAKYEPDLVTGEVPIVGYVDNMISTLTEYTDGMFVLVEHDTGDELSHPARLYLRKNNTWNVVKTFEVETYDEVVKLVETDEIGMVKPTESTYLPTRKYFSLEGNIWMQMSVVPGEPVDKDKAFVYSPRSNGYVYLLRRIKPMDPNGVDYEWKSTETKVQYVAFLTQTEDGLPDFTMRPTSSDALILAADTNSILDGTFKKDEFWKSYVNKWPWEVTEWNRLDTSLTVDIKDASGNIIASNVPVNAYKYDDQVVTEFDVARMEKYCVHTSGQVVLTNGQPTPIEGSGREVQYLVNVLHVDAKLAETTTNKVIRTYPGSVVETMRSHFNNLGAVKNRLYTNTKLYFEPMRSLGFGRFYTDGETVATYPLDISMAFRLHVSPDIADDSTMLESLRESVIRLIDDHMAEGSTNMAVIAQLIKDNNSDSVRYVDVLGINGNESLQTMRCVDPEVRPHLKHELRLLDDNATIDLTRGLTLEFVIADV